MDVRAEAVAGAVAEADDLALARPAARSRPGTAPGARSRWRARRHDRCRCSSRSRRSGPAMVTVPDAAARIGVPVGHPDVDPGVELVAAADVARAVARGDRAVHRPDQPVAARADRARRERPGPCAELLGDLLGDVAEVALEVVLLRCAPARASRAACAARWRAPSVRRLSFAVGRSRAPACGRRSRREPSRTVLTVTCISLRSSRTRETMSLS